MLAADKLQLQSSLKQQATALKEKEFNLHHSNLMTVGTQAAVLASLDVTMFIEFQPPHNSEWGTSTLIPRVLKFFYYVFITSAFCANILVVSQTTMLSLLGSSLALRGPDGSMITATDGLYEERRTVFFAFATGLICTVVSVVLVVWIMLSPESAMVCMSVTIFTGFQIYTQYMRVLNRFNFDESETVTFNDIFDGPAAIMAVPMGWGRRGNRNTDSENNMNGSEHSYFLTRKRSDDQQSTSKKAKSPSSWRSIPKPRECEDREYASRPMIRSNSRPAFQRCSDNSQSPPITPISII